jgi:hypothetical protein
MLVVETAMVTTLIVPWRGSASGWDRRGRRRRVGAVVEAVEEVRRLACDHDDRPGGAEAHDLVGGQQRAAVAVFVAAGDRGPGLNAWPEWRERLAVSRRSCSGPSALLM